MTALRSLIVEDSDNNRELILRLLTDNCPEVEVVGEASDLETAEKLIQEQQPDLVFLDIQINQSTSFELLERLAEKSEINFSIIFITAHTDSEYAMRAIEFAALDYITKPIEPERLCAAVKKAKDRQKKPGIEQLSAFLYNLQQGPQSGQRQLAIHMPKGIIELEVVDNILYFEADGPVCYFYLLNGQRLPSTKYLGHYRQLLINDPSFFQISSKVVINRNHVKRYDHKDLIVMLKNGTKLSCSRRGGQDLKKLLKNEGEMSSIFNIRDYLKNLMGS